MEIMEQFSELLMYGQILLSLLLLLPLFYWIRLTIHKPITLESRSTSLNSKKICVILPMRNEITNVERKLSSIIEEIRHHPLVELIVADSNSEDGTTESARDVLSRSSLENERWRIMNFHVVGKNVALNGVLDGINSEIVIISDADALISPGWLRIVCSRMEDSEIGVVSGIEKEVNLDDKSFDGFYREKSNILRIKESEIDSTPVLEGSILAWKTSALGSFRLNESMNADDAQIGFISVRNGYRAVIDERITFRSFEDTPRRSLKESIRRSQGLSMALLYNADLALSCARKDARGAIFNAFFLYVIFPWIAVMFTVNSVIAFSIDPVIGNNWKFACIAAIILTLISRRGRFLARGILISILAHVQAIFGKRYQNWDPIR